jgi:hypothetical protein
MALSQPPPWYTTIFGALLYTLWMGGCGRSRWEGGTFTAAEKLGWMPGGLPPVFSLCDTQMAVRGGFSSALHTMRLK